MSTNPAVTNLLNRAQRALAKRNLVLDIRLSTNADGTIAVRGFDSRGSCVFGHDDLSDLLAAQRVVADLELP